MFFSLCQLVLGVVQSSRGICTKHTVECQQLLRYSAALTTRVIPVRARSGGGGDGIDGSKGNTDSSCLPLPMTHVSVMQLFSCNTVWEQYVGVSLFKKIVSTTPPEPILMSLHSCCILLQGR